MKKPHFCTKCNDKTIWQLQFHPVEIEVRGKRFKYIEAVALCDVCGEEMYVPDINDFNAKAREEAYKNEGVQQRRGHAKQR